MFFIQVGSHTGQTNNDHVKKWIQRNWSGILIEPVKYLFEKLKSFNTGNDNLIFENVAIDVKSGKRTLYRIDENRLTGLPGYADQLGTFLPDTMRKWPFANRAIEEEVECMTFVQLIEKHNVKKVDLLAIDVEGMDYIILRTFPFHRIKPQKLIYEIRHLPPEDKQESISFIQEHGYTDITEDKDDIHARIPVPYLL